MMLKAILSEVAVLKKLSSSIREIINEANIDCDENGMTIQAMDSSHVSLVSVILHANDFAFYSCSKSMTLGMNVTALNKMLNCCNNEDSVTIELVKEDKLAFSFEN